MMPSKNMSVHDIPLSNSDIKELRSLPVPKDQKGQKSGSGARENDCNSIHCASKNAPGLFIRAIIITPSSRLIVLSREHHFNTKNDTTAGTRVGGFALSDKLCSMGGRDVRKIHAIDKLAKWVSFVADPKVELTFSAGMGLGLRSTCHIAGFIKVPRTSPTTYSCHLSVLLLRLSSGCFRMARARLCSRGLLHRRRRQCNRHHPRTSCDGKQCLQQALQCLFYSKLDYRCKGEEHAQRRVKGY